MPQFEVSHFASQIFWLVVTFTVLYLVMARLALPRVREILQERRERVATDIEKAEVIKTEAEAAKMDYTSVLTNARIQAKKIIAAAEEEATQEIQERSARLDETLARQVREAELLVAKTREDAVGTLSPVSAEVARLILEKITGRKVELSRLLDIVGRLANERHAALVQGDATKLVRKAS